MTFADLAVKLMDEVNRLGGRSPERFAIPATDWATVYAGLDELACKRGKIVLADQRTCEAGYANFLFMGVPIVVEKNRP